MTHEVIMRPGELTVQRGQSTLNKEQSIFMSDAGINTEGIRSVRPVIQAEILPLPRVTTGLSLEGLTPTQKADALRTARLLQGFGLKPDQVTSKGGTEQKAVQVVENAQLDSENPEVLAKSQEILGKGELTDQDRSDLFGLNASRIAKAEELLKESLGRELTDKEKEGILRAHFVGAGEKGKNGEESGVFNVTQEQIAEKTKILKDVGFDQEQRREIIESGLAAMVPPPAEEIELSAPKSAAEILTEIRPEEFSRGSFSNIAYHIQRAIENREINTDRIDAWRERVISIAESPDFPASERGEFERIDEALRAARLATRRVEFVSDPKLIELVAQHPILEPFIGEINQFIAKVKLGRYEERDELALKELIRGKSAPGSDRLHYDPVTRKVSLRSPEPGDYTTTEQFDDFERAKALLEGSIAEVVYQAMREGRVPPKESRDLINAIMAAGEAGDTPEAEVVREMGYQAIEKIINDAKPGTPQEYAMIVEQAIERIQVARDVPILNPDTGEQILDESTGQPLFERKQYRGEYDHVIEFVLEYAVERVINPADKNPDEDYPQLNLYETDNLDRIIYMARQYDETRKVNYREWFPDTYGGREPAQKTPDLFGYLVNLRNKRRIMHELFRGMRDPNTYLQYVTQALRKSGFRFVEKDVVGVKETQRIYEQVLASALALKSQHSQGWLTDQDFAKADIDVERILFRDAERGDYKKTIKRADGSVLERRLRGWEAERASKMGRSLSAASQRRIVYAVMGELPENPDILYKSVESEYIARRLAPLKLFADRFFGQPLAKQLMEIVHRELKRIVDTGKMDYGLYGYIARDPKTGKLLLDANGEPIADSHGHSTAKGLYGQSQEAADILDLLIVDPKSNSWRGRLMFLAQSDYAKDYRIPDGHGGFKTEKVSLREYLETWEKHFHLGHHGTAEQKRQFNDEIAPVIRNQRLYLGILLRHPNLTDANKEMIWQNAAKFIPSRIAAMFPEETEHLIHAVNEGAGEGEHVSWEGSEGHEGLRNKLWRAERLRVAHDAKALKVSGDGVTRELESFFEEVGMTPREIRAVNIIRGLGRSEAGEYYVDSHENIAFNVPTTKEIAHIKQPFTAFLDDAPQTDWENLSDEDFNRILVSDQNDFAEGWGHIVGIIADPVKKTDDVVKVFAETIHKIQGPPGLEAAQVRIEAFVNAVLIQRRATTFGKWFGSILKDFRHGGRAFPRSMMEQFNMQAAVADNERDQLVILKALAQKDVIADDPAELDNLKRTQYLRMLDDNEANRKAQISWWLREFIQLLGPVVGKQFFSGIDMKGLGI